jgi:hypothetical protein
MLLAWLQASLPDFRIECGVQGQKVHKRPLKTENAAGLAPHTRREDDGKSDMGSIRPSGADVNDT